MGSVFEQKMKKRRITMLKVIDVVFDAIFDSINRLLEYLDSIS